MRSLREFDSRQATGGFNVGWELHAAHASSECRGERGWRLGVPVETRHSKRAPPGSPHGRGTLGLGERGAVREARP